MPKKDLRQMKNHKMRKKRTLDKNEVREMAKEANVDVGDIDNKDVRDIEKTIEQYEDKSEGELMSDLERMIRDGRKDGSFSNEMFEGFIKNVAPMMDKNQRKKLEKISRLIKMNKL